VFDVLLDDEEYDDEEYDEGEEYDEEEYDEGEEYDEEAPIIFICKCRLFLISFLLNINTLNTLLTK